MSRLTKSPKILIIMLVMGFSALYLPLAATSIGSRVTLLNSDHNGIDLNFELLDLAIQAENHSGGSFYQITIPGESNLGAPGLPDLPHISRLIAIPPEAVVELEWNSSTPRTLQNHTPAVIPVDGDNSFQKNDANPGYDENQPLFPAEIVELGAPSIMRGLRIIRITFNPVQYNDASGEIIVHDQISARLVFSTGEAVNPVRNPQRLRPSKTALEAIRSLVLNPQDIHRDDNEERGSFIYVIPDFEGVADAIEPLANWRRRQGYPTEVITVDEDASNVEVRNTIREAYEEWEVPPEYVTLVGDGDLVNADFMIPAWDVGHAYMWETDYKYILLEGNDLLPEAAVGRISARSLAELRNVVDKIYLYESDPFMEETDWFTNAALMSNDERTGYSSIYLQRWLRKMLLEVGFAEVDTFYFIHNNPVSDHDFILNNMNDGISLFNYRGWGAFNGAWTVGDNRLLNNGQKLPLLILPTCNTNDFVDHILYPHGYAEDFMWAPRGGAIGTIGSSGFTHTNYNNVLDGGILNALYRDNAWQIGWALNLGKIELYRHFGLFNDVADPQVQDLLCWEAHAYQFNLIGDAGTELWTDVPQTVEVIHNDRLSTGQNHLSVRVQDAESDEPLPGVTVTLVRGDQIMRVDKTTADGFVEFSFIPGELNPGDIQLTATRHNMIPYLTDITVEVDEVFLGFSSLIIDDDQAGRSRGNGDGLPSPGETIELRTYIANYGDEAAQGALDLFLEPVLGDVRLIENRIQLNNAPALRDSALATFVFTVNQVNMNNQRLLFQLTVNSGQTDWHSAIEIPIAAPQLEVAGFEFDPDPFDTGDTAWVDVTLRNVGGVASNEMTATLVSGREVVNVFEDLAQYSPIDPEADDSLATARFRIHSHTLTVPGTNVTMTILLEDDAGFRDTTEFSFIVGEASNGTPFGPDTYGYVCFDDTDGEWDGAPEYEWIEIDPNRGGNGTDTEIRDHGNEQDFSVLVDLPFDFQYYGENFDQVTICSNGWLALGDEIKLADFQNRRIPPALGPRAQVCVFWDDLVNYTDVEGNQIGGIYYWYDADNHRFVVEWSRMRRYIGRDDQGNMRQGSENTFQAILLDPQHYPTYTGDGELIFQYHTVNNDPDVDPLEFDTPYATVGIVNLNGTDGLEYTFWNEYADGAAILRDNRAIKFSTRLIAVVGAVRGVVRDAETGQEILGAEIRGSRGSFALSRVDGSYIMSNVLIGDSLAFTAWAPGYNDSTKYDFCINDGDTLDIDFDLLHPEFNMTRQEINIGVQPGYGAFEAIRLNNDGNGQLVFSSYLDYREDEEHHQWQRLLHFNATDMTDDDRLNGVDFFQDAFWVTGSNNYDNPNLFYRFNRQGQLAGSVPQPGESSYGFRGTTTDGEFLYGGDDEWIYKVNAAGEPVDSIPGPFDLQLAIAYDHNDHFWVANGRNDPLVKINRQGEIVYAFQHELNIYGLGYFPNDPDGYPLYILSRDKSNPALEVPYALVSKFNPETESLRLVTVLEAELEDRAGGMEIVNTYDPQKWVMIAVLTNSSGDKVSVYDMGPNTNWVTYEPRFGRLDAEQTTLISFTFTSENLAPDEYGLLLRYLHNASGLQTSIPITMRVGENESITDENVIPIAFNLEQNFPNPFNATTGIPFTLPEETSVRLTVYDLTGREVATLIEGKLKAGNHRIEFDAERLPSGIYIARLTAGSNSAKIKLALLK